MWYDNYVIKIKLPGDYTVLIDDADQMLVAGFAWRVQKITNSELMYARAWHNRMLFLMHRLILGAAPDDQVDHWNGNGLDNQRHNLRIASYSQQRANQGKQRNRLTNRPSTSQYKGVCWDKSRSKWIASLGVRTNRRQLGRFASEEDAARAYDAAAVEEWGQFARLNFPVDNGAVCGRHKLAIPDAPCTCEIA